MILVPLCSCSFITRSSQPHTQFRDCGQQPSGTFHHQSTRVVVASGTYRVGERTLGRVILGQWTTKRPTVVLPEMIIKTTIYFLRYTLKKFHHIIFHPATVSCFSKSPRNKMQKKLDTVLDLCPEIPSV